MSTAPMSDFDWSNIDWPLLRNQKADLIELLGQREDYVEGHVNDDWVCQLINGLLNLIDALQDHAVTAGIAKEEDVYMPEELEEN